MAGHCLAPADATSLPLIVRPHHSFREDTTMASRSDGPALHADTDGDTAVVHISDTYFGIPNGVTAVQGLLRIIHELGLSRLTLDFGAVDFLSSLGLAALLTAHTLLRARGGRLTVRNVRPHIYEIFAVTRLTTVLDVCPAVVA
jgi:anti-anti-sigma factor